MYYCGQQGVNSSSPLFEACVFDARATNFDPATFVSAFATDVELGNNKKQVDNENANFKSEYLFSCLPSLCFFVSRQA